MMYAIEVRDKNGESWLLPAFNCKSKAMTFDDIEDAKANLAVCKSATAKDVGLSTLGLTFKIVDYENMER